MAERCGQDAADDVLSNPDLVYRILEGLPMPSSRWNATQVSLRSDGGAASHVNRAFRQAALRLPWSLSWGHYTKATPPEDLAAAARFFGSRNLQGLTLHGKLEGFGAALRCATSLESLTLNCGMQELSADWAQHTRLQLEGVGGSAQPTSLTACLSSLSRLTSLKVDGLSAKGTRASWLLAAAPQLQHLTLSLGCGPPLEGGPHLKSLHLDGIEVDILEGTLDQWAAPGLTALSVCLGEGVEGLVQGPSQRGRVARDLQRLHLDQCCFDLQGVGLRDIFPCLTYLFIGNFTEEWPPESRCRMNDHSRCLDAVLRKALPVSLKELVIRFLNNTGGVPRYVLRALSHKLVHLESLELRLVCVAGDIESAAAFWPEDERSGGPLSNKSLETIFKGLMWLPSLRDVCLELSATDDALLQDRCQGLEAQLKSRGGYLRLPSFL